MIDGGGVVGLRVGDGPLAIFETAKEATLVAFVADAGTESFDFDEDGVEVAIGGDFLDHHSVAGALTFEPELAAGAAIEGGETGLDGETEGFLIHVADHEDAASGVVLNDRRDEAVGFLEIEIH